MRTPFDPFLSLPLPDPLLARRALSGMRTIIRSGYGLARQTLDKAPFPTPVMAVAGTVLSRVDDLARLADAAASSVAHGVLEVAGIPLDAPGDGRALGAALRAATVELGATDLRVSEAAVREAIRRDPPGLSEEARAAALMRRLLAANAVRSTAPAASAMIPVAVFAAVLSEAQEQAGDPAGIAASAAIADAIAAEIRAAGADEAALARLFGEFADHV